MDAVCNISLLHLGPEKEKKTHYYGHHTRKVVVGLKKKAHFQAIFTPFLHNRRGPQYACGHTHYEKFEAISDKRNEWRNP